MEAAEMIRDILNEARILMLQEAALLKTDIKFLMMRQGARAIQGDMVMAREIGEVIVMYKMTLKELHNDYRATIRRLEHSAHIGVIGKDAVANVNPWSRSGITNYQSSRIKQQDLGAAQKAADGDRGQNEHGENGVRHANGE